MKSWKGRDREKKFGKFQNQNQKMMFLPKVSCKSNFIFIIIIIFLPL